MDDRLFKATLEKAIKKDKFKSTLIHPRNEQMYRGLITPQKQYSMKLFRRVSEKAWLINTVIGHIIDKVTPYMRPMSAKGTRGFAIELKDPDKKMTAADRKRAKEIQEFFLKTGWDNSLQHEDDLIHYNKKILRDVLTLDQVATEKLWARGGDLLSFEAVDAATIVRCNEKGYEGDDKIRFVQMVENQVTAQYHKDQLIFQFQNPRTDIEHYGYGYSKIEQCLDLVLSLIHSFQYNAGAFTEDKLPRGMLLLNGDVDFEAVEEIEDYMVDVMGGGVNGPSGKWGIPIIPSGKSGDKTSISWQPMGSSNQDMQFSRWQDTLYMSVGSVFGVDIESMGIKSEKGAKIMESGSAEGRKYSDDKGIGNALTFLERHYQNILDDIDPKFTFVFHGFEQNDAKEQRDAVKDELSTFKSLNDILRENDMPESEEPWADIPGLQNESYRQLYLDAKGGEEEGMGEGGDEWGDDEWSGKSRKDKTVRIVI